MCPSYMVTLEEEHSTRGRAHMLFEMLQSEITRDGWDDEGVKKSLDLCLSCKACKTECPANVDMATYKAEFLAHYYEGRRRPLRAYAFGMVDKWMRLGSIAPGAANLASRGTLTGGVLRRVLGLADERRLPELAAETFRAWARKNRVGGANLADAQGEVILWADTFNNYLHPETSRAALGVLQGAGFGVRVPREHLCCGRPLYDFGMLDEAKRYLQNILEALREPIEAGVPVVVLEPSCASVFRDELCNLFPGNARAARLRDQTFLLSEFLERQGGGFQPARLDRKVLLHGHCHHKSLMKMNDEESLLRKMGAQLQSIDSGCCGMAGPFGFEKEKYGVSQAIGERVLLPAVRGAEAETLIVSDGFSCREQIYQSTGRRALHLAEVLQMAAAGAG
ncbi:MAG: (Fe-S)-binding protein, partial [Terracidiphilus sp.]